MNKISHFLLNLIACWILEPRLESLAAPEGGHGSGQAVRWKISSKALQKLKPALQDRLTAMENAQELFAEIGMCRGCDASCCRGAFNRFTVYDHISHLLMEMEGAPEWGYHLKLFRSYEFNRSDDGSCHYYVENSGCSLDLAARPAQCIWYACSGIEIQMSPEQKKRLLEIRKELDKVFWAYARVLVFGGMSARRPGRRSNGQTGAKAGLRR